MGTTTAAATCGSSSSPFIYNTAGDRTFENPGDALLHNGDNIGFAYTSTGQRQHDCIGDNGACTNLIQNYTYEGATTNSSSGYGGNASYANTFVTGLLGMTQDKRQNGSGTTLTTVNIIRDPYGNPLVIRAGGASYDYTLDIRGSAVRLSDASQTTVDSRSYDPWGVLTADTGTQANYNPIGYDGGTYTVSNLTIRFGARWYHPSTGQWTQADPAGHPITDPSQANPYTFAGNNPVNNADRSGQSLWSDIGSTLDSAWQGAEAGGTIGGTGGALIGCGLGIEGGPAGCLAGGVALGGIGLVGGSLIGGVVGLFDSGPAY